MPSKQTTQLTYTGPWKPFTHPAVLTVQANGGSVTLEFRHDDQGDEWITDQTISADAVLRVEIGNVGAVRITPAGGATFSWSAE